MKSTSEFSVVMATYTGADTIGKTFSSLLDQDSKSYEVVVVVDGPNDKIQKSVETAQKKFEEQDIKFRTEQFKRNKGRFEARLTGAKIANNRYILIIDDRVILPEKFLTRISTMREEAVMSDVQEKASNNFISLTLNRIRRKLYGKKWGTDFKPFYIDTENFDSSPKGTTSLWVNRNKFIQACEQIIKQTTATKYLNDDTRILKYLVDHGTKIYKTSELKIIYEPRSKATDELNHIYHRGPRFLDYYFQPGTRYFAPLLLFYTLLIPFLAAIIVWPWLLLILFVSLVVGGVFLSVKLTETPKIALGTASIIICFGAGLITGLIRKVV